MLSTSFVIQSLQHSIQAAVDKENLQKLDKILKTADSKHQPAMKQIAWEAFKYAFSQKKFFACRYLIEHGVDLNEVQFFIDQEKQSSDVKKLKVIIQDIRNWGVLFSKDKEKQYHDARLNNILQNNIPNVAFDELVYIKKIRGIHSFVMDFIKRAINMNKDKVLEDAIQCVRPELQDNDGNNALMFAVMSGNLSMVKIVCQNFNYAPAVCRNKLGQTAFDIARSLSNLAIADYLTELQLENEKNTRYGASVLQLPSMMELKESDFIFTFEGEENATPTNNNPTPGKDLTTKGRTLVLNDLAKLRQDELVFTVRGKQEFMRILDEFVRNTVRNEAYILLDETPDIEFSVIDHCDAVKLEKIDGITYIIYINSVRDNANYDDSETVVQENIPRLIQKHCPHLIPHVVYCENGTNQQTGELVCYYFALNNKRLMLKQSGLAQEILNKHILKEAVVNGIKCIQFRLPARFMQFAQSPDGVENYKQENKSEDLSRVNDAEYKIPISFDKYVNEAKEGFGVKTPIAIKNRHFGEAGEPEFVLKNEQVYHYKSELIQSKLPALLEQKELHHGTKRRFDDLLDEPHQKELRDAIRKRDSRFYTTDASGEFGHIDDLKMKKQKRIHEWLQKEAVFDNCFLSESFKASVTNGETLLSPDTFVFHRG